MEKNLGIKWYDTLDSTNSQAARELETAAEGCVWIADFQTQGRGQRGNKWESGKGENLTFSILLRPEFLHPSRQFLISQICALGVSRYLNDKGLPAKIKWPNDIYIGDKKICGILIENSISGDKLAVSVAGIGFNLNQTRFASDAPNPTSMLLEFLSRQMPLPANPQSGAGKAFNRKEELASMLGYIFTAYQELQEGYDRELENEYTGNLYRLGELHRFIETDPEAPADMPVEKMATGNEITARIIGVDQYGCAILELENGERRTYPFKGIRYVI